MITKTFEPVTNEQLFQHDIDLQKAKVLFMSSHEFSIHSKPSFSYMSLS